jgi:MFS family permease
MRLLPTDVPEPLTLSQRRRLIAALSFTQMAAWGTTFYLPSVIGGALARDLGLSTGMLFGGVTLMMLVSALFSPALGRHVDRAGARLPMSAGAGILALGLAILAGSSGPIGYLVAFAIFGVGSALSMSNPSFAAVAQACPGEGRRPIALMMLVSGLASGVYWPITGWLEAHYGWRASALIYAAVNLLLCLPLHVWLVRRPLATPFSMDGVLAGRDTPQIPAGIPSALRRRAIIWIVLGAGLSGVVSWGLPLHFIPMFNDAGVAMSTAILLASLQAPATMISRMMDIALSRRIAAVRLVMLAGLLVPLLMFSLWLLMRPPVAGNDVWLIAISVFLYGACTGLIAMARSTLPLELFGPHGYATLLGRMSLVLNMMFAIAPLLFAWLRQIGGAPMTLWVGLILSLVAAYAFHRLDRLASGRG